MEQHPVPQNVTTFQFRLIGDMTIKQFGYLCAGAILAFIAYKLPLPLIVTWPLSGVFAFLGVGFAFIPVEERPMDVWVFSFFKSIYSPTQYIWAHEQQQKQQPDDALQNPAAQPAKPEPKTVLSGLFPQQPPTQHAPPPARASFLDNLFSVFRPPPKTAAPAPQPPVTGYRPAPIQRGPQQIAVPTAPLMQKITQLEEALKILEGRLATKTVTENRVLELQQQLTGVLQQKSQTEEELVALKRKLPAQQPHPAQIMTHGVVNVITTQEAAVKVGLPRLTNTPNVITGIVKDDAGNFLPGILITVTNHEGIPVRALKTNKLGQFAASTPLTSGTYFVEIEDPRQRFTFSRVQLTLNGGVVPVIEIIAKSEKVLSRERLAQELFGKQS